jgi:hypothetical protein
MPRKTRAQFLLDPELSAGLKALKRRDGTPEGESVRRALTAYLGKQGVLKTEGKRSASGPATRKRS